MIRSYLAPATRNLVKGRLYTIINLICLSLGMAAFLLILLFIRDELNYDRFHPASDRMYRVVQVLQQEGGGEESSSLPFPMRRIMLNEMSGEIESAVRLFNFQSPYASFSYGYRRHIEHKFYFADSNFFDLFGVPLALGNPRKALREANTVVITPEAAEKYFGELDPIGRVLLFDGKYELQVTGVTAPAPGNSHLDFDFIISMETLGPVVENLEKNYVWNPFWTYVVLREGAVPAQVEKKLFELGKKYVEPTLKKKSEFHLQPVTDIHLRSRLDYEMHPNSDISNLYIFTGVALFILLIGCVNFMNLSTARSAARAQEVGIRKVAGASRGQLITQILLESVLLSLLAVIPALSLVELLTPAFNQLSGKFLSLDFVSQPGLIISTLALAVGVGLVSGIYPALFLSSFEPTRVLKGVFQQGRRSMFFRKTLVVVQFTLSVVLIISTLIARQQLGYLRTASLGFDRENLLMVPCDRTNAWEKTDSIRTAFAEHPGFAGMTRMDYMIGVQTNTHNFLPETRDTSSYSWYPALKVDWHFVNIMGMTLVAGRDFSDMPGEDTLSVIVNEAMVKQMNWNSPQEAIGKLFRTRRGKERIVGVVKDFNFGSLRQPIGPFVLDLSRQGVETAFFTKYLAVRVKPEHREAFIAHAKRVWEYAIPSRPFDYIWLSDAIGDQYEFEEKLGRIFTYFSALAVFIACLSLYGLSAFSTRQRRKEIGIRRVLGASGFQIAKMLLADFAKPVLVAILVAIPLAWIGMSAWLEGFAYHVSISISVFIFAAAIALGIALLTTCYHALASAFSSPVESIRRG